MVDPLSSFSFQPVLYNWYSNGHGMCYPVCGKGKEKMFYLMTHSTHFIFRLYGIRHMVKYQSDSERKPAAITWATLSY